MFLACGKVAWTEDLMQPSILSSNVLTSMSDYAVKPWVLVLRW